MTDQNTTSKDTPDNVITLRTQQFTDEQALALAARTWTDHRTGLPFGARLGMARTPHPAEAGSLGGCGIDPPKRQVDHGRCGEIGHADFGKTHGKWTGTSGASRSRSSNFGHYNRSQSGQANVCKTDRPLDCPT
jgi:hypothetical protein